MKNCILFILVTFLISCGQSNRNNHNKQLTVKSYKKINPDIHDPNDWIYLYIVLGSDNTYYYYSSPQVITDFSGINNWTASDKPLQEMLGPDTETMGEQTVDADNFSPEFQAEFEMDNADYFESQSPAEMGDYEGGGEPDAGSPSESSFDGGSDAGGGDSGGGDSGGGGE